MSMKPISLANLTRALHKLTDIFVQIKDAVKSVNGIEPDASGDIQISRVDFAGNLESDSAQSSTADFIARTTGGDASITPGDAWLISIMGKSEHTGQVEEELDMTVIPIEREEGEPITATLDRDTFISAVSTSGTITLTYTTSWSETPANYGVTVTGTPIAGDQIVIEYVKGERGTITNATPTAFKSSNWNLYNSSEGYARVVRYSDDYGYRIEGAYSALSYASTPTGTRTTITPVENLFMVPADGYVFVTNGNATTTSIFPTWSDWTGGYSGNFTAHSESTIDLSDVMDECFPNGLFQVGVIRDEINLNTAQAISRIERLAYSAENLETAVESGRAYDADEDYIYLVRETPENTTIVLDGSYHADDHGVEWFEGSSLPVGSITIYGANLKNKLERDVLTISQQDLSSTEQAQVRANINAASGTDFATLSNGLTDTIMDYAFRARGVLANGTNLNDVSATNQYGIWRIENEASGETMTNMPTKLSAYGTLLVMPGRSSNQRKQFFFPADTTVYAGRTRTSSTNWGNWSYFYAGATPGAFLHNQIPSNSDLNNISDTGWWYCSSSSACATLTNCPVNSASFAMACVSRGSYKSQIIFTGSTIYVRIQNSSGWSSTWNTFSSKSYFNAPQGTIPTGEDLNDYKTPGTYFLSASNTYTNAPASSITAVMEVFQPTVGASEVSWQRVTTSTGVMYTRYKGGTSSAAFGTWKTFTGT